MTWFLSLTDLLLYAIAALLPALFVWLIQQRRQRLLREENIRLRSELNAEQRLLQEQRDAYTETRKQLGDSFNSLAAEALKHNNDEFLRLAKESFKQLHLKSQHDLEQKEKAVESMVKPIRETLDKTERQIREMEKDRQHAYGSLHKHLESMGEMQKLLQAETRNLVQALRRPEVRGRWGELTLKRLVELAGMVEHCDFSEQEQTVARDGRQIRPDMVVQMPDNRIVVVDAKTPLDAYLTAVEATTDTERQTALTNHAHKVRERVRELAAKGYWRQFDNTPDFVVMFIPGEQFLSAALELDRNLLEDALADRVILATPTSLVALLRAVAYGWRQQQLAQNAEKIRIAGEEMHDRLTTFTMHLTNLGSSLASSVDHFNKAVGSFSSRVLPGARKFTAMGIHGKKELPEIRPLERAVRTTESDSKSETTG